METNGLMATFKLDTVAEVNAMPDFIIKQMNVKLVYLEMKKVMAKAYNIERVPTQGMCELNVTQKENTIEVQFIILQGKMIYYQVKNMQSFRIKQ